MNVKELKQKANDIYEKTKAFVKENPKTVAETAVTVGSCVVLICCARKIYQLGVVSGYSKCLSTTCDFTPDSMLNSTGRIFSNVVNEDGKEYIGLILSAVNTSGYRVAVGGLYTPSEAVENARNLLQAVADQTGEDVQLKVIANGIKKAVFYPCELKP